jgi:tetratricopeptide (TPR) repeat protein
LCRHVEAISNLAATLLALNRPEEALQHWLRAVKLRPSYFEAVEHLIGLLCSTHRGREAVNIIEYVEVSLRVSNNGDCFRTDEHSSETESDGESTGSYDRVTFDYDADMELNSNTIPILNESNSPGFGSSGYAIPGTDNGRMLALVHAKGNMLYALGDNSGAARAFEDGILIAAGRRRHGIQSLIRQVISAFTTASRVGYDSLPDQLDQKDPVLLYPEKALQTANLVFPPYGNPPGFQFVSEGLAKKAAMSTTSNSLLSLAKIYQDGMAHSSPGRNVKVASGVREILALYYLSLSLQPSPSTANNVGILLASIQHNGSGKPRHRPASETSQVPEVPGVVPGSGISLALAYYHYGLNLDSRHAHLYTNLGSLLKDIGQLQAAIRMYEQAVQCDGTFDIALANLANAVKDAGRINDAIGYYKRAVRVNPEFAEAVCGLANALNSVCNWVGRGGISKAYGFRDRWHVDERAMIREISPTENGSGWMQRVVDIVNQQLREGETWGRGLLSSPVLEQLCAQLTTATTSGRILPVEKGTLATMLRGWYGKKWEGSRIVRLVERAIRAITWQWYQDRYVYGREYPVSKYRRPQLPAGLTTPNAPTVLPFHTFTYPLSAKQIRHISQRNGLRISSSTLRSSWLPPTVYPPPFPPNPYLKVGYVSSDFNNHPLAHLMQSVFGLHNPKRVKAFCYATTPSDNSIHRSQIERESPAFYDVSGWSVDRLVNQIVKDGIHILVNLNGYTRGARNEVFAARPAPIHMSFMGFAGTLGAEWCDYILADEISIPRETLSPGRRDARIEDRIFEDNHAEDIEDWVYGEKIVFTRDTFFCCDHRQSAPGSDQPHMSWADELRRRWKMRKELFPHLSDDTIILGNFNQLYKVKIIFVFILFYFSFNFVLFCFFFPSLLWEGSIQPAQM